MPRRRPSSRPFCCPHLAHFEPLSQANASPAQEEPFSPQHTFKYQQTQKGQLTPSPRSTPTVSARAYSFPCPRPSLPSLHRRYPLTTAFLFSTLDSAVTVSSEERKATFRHSNIFIVCQRSGKHHDNDDDQRIISSCVLMAVLLEAIRRQSVSRTVLFATLARCHCSPLATHYSTASLDF